MSGFTRGAARGGRVTRPAKRRHAHEHDHIHAPGVAWRHLGYREKAILQVTSLSNEGGQRKFCLKN